MSVLIDSFNRVHTDLRVSLTDRCSLRCTYCMPEDFSNWLPKNDILSAAEILEVISVAVEHGVTQVRLTGGEPLIRHDIVDIVREIASLPNPPSISVTTNAIRLAQLAKPLKEAGLSRVNVSLDTLSPERFKELTKRDEFAAVIAGIEAAAEVGLHPIKINTVLMPGVNDDEAPALLSWALANGYELRFIEQMPLDAGGTWKRDSMITAEEIVKELGNVFNLVELPHDSSAPAQDFQIAGTDKTVGVIASVTKPFCANCDRLRLTADGQLRNCLFAREETDLRTILREVGDINERRTKIAQLMGLSVAAKKAGHGIGEPDFAAPQRPMSAIGG